MIEIFPRLFIGSGPDLIHADNGHGGISAGWFVVSAAKTFHKEILGYEGNAAPKDSAEYLIARRERRLILNLIDAPDPDYIPETIMAAAVEAIDVALDAGDKVLCHCNAGQSRAPMIGLLWLRYSKFSGPFIKRLSFDDAMAAYAELYPPLSPGEGVKAFVKAKWEAE